MISGGELLLQDRMTDHTILARGAELRPSRWSDGLPAQLAFELEQAGEPATVLAEGRLDAATAGSASRSASAACSAAELARIEPTLPLQGVDLVLAGQADRRGRRSRATSRRSSSSCRSASGAVERPDLLAGPCGSNRASVDGRDRGRSRAVTVREAARSSPKARRSTAAEVACARPADRVRAEVQAQNVAARDLELYWPLAAGREARAWVVANITDGVRPKAEATIAFEPATSTSVRSPRHRSRAASSSTI